jgi:Na+/melibiose symporter-like transporter
MTIKLSPQANANANTNERSSIGLVFISAYACHGIAQHFCLIAQPLNNFLKVGLRLDAASSALYVSILMFPWVIKPIYGMVSDTGRFAQPGQNRLRFLVWVHLLAGLAYGTLALVLFCLPDQPPAWIVFPAIALTALAGVGIAFATVVFVAMTVDRSQLGESPRVYFGQQALAYSLANIAAVSIGGALCAHLAASLALAWGLAIASATLLLLPLVFVRFLDRDAVAPDTKQEEEQEQESKDRASLGAKVKALVGNRSFILTLLFLTLWNLSPSLGVSLYFYECDKLEFSQGIIGTLTACTSTGTLIGAFVFRYWLAQFFTGGRSTYLLVALGVVSNLSYILLSTPMSGMVIELFRGFVTFIATLAIYGLAADVSPRGLTATAMAIQIAVLNLAMEGSIALGGFLYGRVFGKELLPLIVVSSLTTLLTLFLIPYLPAAGCKQGLKPAG